MLKIAGVCVDLLAPSKLLLTIIGLFYVSFVILLTHFVPSFVTLLTCSLCFSSLAFVVLRLFRVYSLVFFVTFPCPTTF